MSKNDIILIGGGGHCKSCIDVIEVEGNFYIAGIIDVKEKLHKIVSGYKIIANDKDFPEMVKKYKNMFITIGNIKNPSKRIKNFEYLKQLGANFPAIVSPLAHMVKSASIEEGTIVMHKALVNANAFIGKNCIINTSVLIEHDSRIGDHCHISTGSIINGACTIGDRVFIGSGSVVIDNVNIGNDVVIGAGSLVLRSIEKPGIYMGNPVHIVNTKYSFSFWERSK